MTKEAQARIKINKLLEAAGWRFFDDADGPASIVLEPKVKLTQAQVDAMGNDFESNGKGFIDFLLLDAQGFPLVVLEAKAESKNPLIGKEQARKYARSQNCRFVILSNGNLHYLWDLSHGNPHIITAFPAQNAIKGYAKFQPDPARLAQGRNRRNHLFCETLLKHDLLDIIETKRLTDLNVYPAFGMSDFKAVPPAWRTRIPEYVNDYVPLNQFM
jgi:type I restriction enzyme R subunit